MKKLEEIRVLCDQAIKENEALKETGRITSVVNMEAGRAELAEEILEILNGDNK